MNAFFNFSEITAQVSELYKQAKEMTGKDMDVQSLDKSVAKDVESVKETDDLQGNSEASDKESVIVDQKEVSDFRPLTDEEKQIVQELTGMTDANLDKCMINSEGLIDLRCINSEYAGEMHPETGIPYVKKIVNINGVEIQVVVPEFPSVVDTTLPKELIRATEAEQFKYLNNWLKDAIQSNPELKSQFTDTQIQMIENGLKPKGYTWHHNEECGKMQLVKSDIHDMTRHTGGNSIWSGGN